MIEKKRRQHVVNVSEIIFLIGFIILITVAIYFISKGIGSTDIKMELTKVYTSDQASAIKSVADSTVGKVNNTIAVSAIFFTIVVASITVFQFLKIKDIDGMKKEITEEVAKNNRLINLKITKSSKKLNEIEILYSEKLKSLEEDYIHKTNKIQDMILELESKIAILNSKSIELEIDTNYVQAKELSQRSVIPIYEVIQHYEKIKSLCLANPNVKTKEFLAKIYIDLSDALSSFGDNCNYDCLKQMLEDAVDFTDDPILESCAYKIMVRLEETFFEDGGNKICYLEKIMDENSWDTYHGIKLAAALDERNEEGDLNDSINWLEKMVDKGGMKVREKIIKLKNDGFFTNILNSSLAGSFHKLLKLDR